MAKPGGAPPTAQQFEAYQQMYDYFNRELFGGSLPSVLLNFSRLSRTYGFFAPERWRSSSGRAKTHEISLNPVHLMSRPAREVASTLVHEMVHLWQHEHGEPSRSGYHNKQWAEKMLAVGLHPSDTGEAGGKETGQHMSHYIEPGGPFDRAFARMPEAFLLPWRGVPEDESGRGGGGGGARNKIKYACPNGHGNVWGKPDLALICGVCTAPYEGQ